jgi:hypothetical protein
MSSPEPCRRCFQFSLRTLLILVTVVAGLAFGWIKAVEPYRLQREAMAVITKLGGTYKTEDATGCVRYFDRNAQDVVVVDLADCDKPDEYLPHLARLPRLRSLVIGGHSVGDEQVAALGRIGSLHRLVLDSTLVTDECADKLKSDLPDLAVYKSQWRAIGEVTQYLAYVPRKDYTPVPEHFGEDVEPWYFDEPAVVVHLHREAVTDADLRWLMHLKDVRAIYAMQTSVSGTFLADVKGASSLERLHLDNTQVDDSTLPDLSRFPRLSLLTLRDTRLTDHAVPALEKATSLSRLLIARTAITPDGVKRLRSALPHCDVQN